MRRVRPARLAALGALCAAAVAGADTGATLSLQSDARERGLSYSGHRPSAQLSLAWDGEGGWYAGALLTRARFDAWHQGPWWRAYVGRVVTLGAGVDGEAGLLAHRFGAAGRYDFAEAYVGVLGEAWSLRLHGSPDYFGSGQRTLYAEANLRRPLAAGLSAVVHAGLLRGQGAPAPAYAGPHGPTRTDLRAGLSWPLGAAGELQLAWVTASRGGPYTWAEPSPRHATVLGLSLSL